MVVPKILFVVDKSKSEIRDELSFEFVEDFLYRSVNLDIGYFWEPIEGWQFRTSKNQCHRLLFYTNHYESLVIFLDYLEERGYNLSTISKSRIQNRDTILHTVWLKDPFSVDLATNRW